MTGRGEAHKAFQGAMQDQACQWIARLRADSVDQEDYEEFAAWLASNPEHRTAFDSMTELWGDLAVVRHLQNAKAPHAQPGNPSRRRWLAGSFALAASLLLAVVLTGRFDADVESQRYQTGVGEQISVDLEDGSAIQLNTDSSLAVDFSTRVRRLTLNRGEAFFQVAKEPQRPFLVRAGSVEVRALGTAFNIHLKGETGVVTVTEGVVRVTELSPPTSRPPQTELLYRNQRIIGGASGIGSPSSIDTSRQLAWRDGKLVAEEMPLATLVEELSRYHPNQIFIAEPALAGKTLSGVFRLEDLDGILLALEHSAGVRSVTLEDGSIQLISAPL
jgi:transmembrane sensor